MKALCFAQHNKSAHFNCWEELYKTINNQIYCKSIIASVLSVHTTRAIQPYARYRHSAAMQKKKIYTTMLKLLLNQRIKLEYKLMLKAATCTS